MQNMRSLGIYMTRPELRTSLLQKFARLQAREAQLRTRVSAMRKQEIELQGQLQNFHQEFFCSSNSDYKFEDDSKSRVGAAIADIELHTQSNADSSLLLANFEGAESFRRESRRERFSKFEGTKKLPWLGEMFGNRQRLTVAFLRLLKAVREPARIESPWEDAHNMLNSWRYAAEEMCPTSAGSEDIVLFDCRTHRWRHMPVSSIGRWQTSLLQSLSPLMTVSTLCKQKTN